MIKNKGVYIKNMSDEDTENIKEELSDIVSGIDDIVSSWNYSNLSGYTTKDLIFDLREYIDSLQDIINILKTYIAL